MEIHWRETDSMRKKELAALVIAVFLLAAGFFGGTSLAQAAPEEAVRTLSGFQAEILWSGRGLTRIGHETPVTVRISSSGPEVSGSAIVYVPADKDNYYMLEKTLSVSSGETKQAVISVPVDYATSMIRVEYRGDDGTLYAAEMLNLRPNYANQEIYMGVITHDLKKLSVFDRIVLNEYRGTTTRLFDFKESTLPEESEALSLYDIFLWDEADLEKISQEQRMALRNWVYDGGILLIGNPNDFDTEVPAGEIVRESWGRGQYVYCGFSLKDMELRYPDEAEMRSFLYEAVGEERLNAIEESIEYGYNDYWEARGITFNADPDRIPSVWQYGLVLAIYILVLGPILYFVLKRKGRRNMLRGAMVGIALLFTGVIYLMGSRTRFTRPFLNYASIREIRDDMVMETVFTNICSPYNKEYSFHVDESYRVSPLPYYKYSNGVLDIAGGACKLHIRYGEENTLVRIDDEIPFTSELLRMTRDEKSIYGEGFTGQIRMFRGKLEGTFTNCSDQNFENVCILLGGRLVFVGDMAAGEEVDLAKAELMRLPYYSRSKILEKMTGVERYRLAGDEKHMLTAIWRNQILTYYMDSMMTKEKNEAAVLAFPVGSGETMPGQTEIDVRGITLVTTLIPVDYTKKGQIYVPELENEPETLQGNYNSVTNSVYEQVNVIQYDFGSMKVEGLLAEWPEEQEPDSFMQAFHGTMEFYNWRTRSYEYVDKKSEYNRAELRDFLDEENRLTVRYEDNKTEEYHYEVLLPDFSVVGREIQ